MVKRNTTTVAKKKMTSIVGKSRLAEAIYKNKGSRSSLTESQIKSVIERLLEEIKKSLLRGEEIRLQGYFSLLTTVQKPRVAMNLQTGKKMNIPAKRVPKCKFSGSLKEEISKRK